MASKLREDFPPELECSICLQPFSSPRILPCVHSYCLVCLEEWFDKSDNKTQVSCPLCKDVSPIPPGGVKEIKKNFFIEGLIERLEKTHMAKTSARCDTEECNNPAEHFCTESCGYLCDSCLKHHRRVKGSKDHQVVSADDPKVTMQASQQKHPFCPKHPGETIHVYCRDCELAACSTCLLLSHRQHHLVELSEQAQLSNQQLENLIKQMDVTIEQIDQHVADRVKHHQTSSQDIQQIKQQVDKIVDGMITKLNQRRQTLFAELDKTSAQRDKAMINIEQEQDFTRTALISLRSYSHRVLKHGRDYDRVEQIKDITSRLDVIRGSVIPTYVWMCKGNKGPVTTTDLTVAKVTVNTEITDPVQAVTTRGELLLSKIPLVVKNEMVTGMALIGQTLWVVHFKQSDLHAVHVTSHQSQTFTLQGLTRPQNMVTSPPGESQLVISDWDNKQLLWIKVKRENNTWQVTSQRAEKVNYKPIGLVVSGDVLLVCGGGSIHMLSTSGQEIQTVKVPQTVRPYKALSHPTRPGYIVLDYVNKQVALVSEKGEVQQTYRGQEGFKPYDVTYHNMNIIIADPYNHRVHRLSLDGSYIDDVITHQQGVTYPTSLCVNQSGRLYVAHGRNENNSRQVLMMEHAAPPGEKLPVKETRVVLTITWCN